MRLLRRVRDAIERRFGDRMHAKAAFLLALVLSLEAADAGAIGGMGIPLQRSLGVSKAQFGLLFSLEAATSIVGTLVFGWLVDKTNRTRLLAIAIVLWGAVLIACGAAPSYGFLLASQAALGTVIGAAQPTVASLVGDLFRPEHRAEIYGSILAGELIGTAFGTVASGLLAVLSWRLGFWVLVVPTPALAWALHRFPEPARGGASWPEARVGSTAKGDDAASRAARIGARARARGIEPRARLVRKEDPRGRSLLWAVGYVLRIPTNVILVAASALGYFFFSGLRIFSIEFLSSRFLLSHAAAVGAAVGIGTGSLVGVYAGGHVTDAFLARGKLRARVWVAASAYLASALLFLGALLVPRFAPFVVLTFFAGACLAAVNPPLDAARLDIMHARLWGRAEAIRTMVRKVGEATAPVLFGYVAGDVFGGGAWGLRAAFLLMTIPLAASGVVGLLALRTYLADAASADAFMDETGM